MCAYGRNYNGKKVGPYLKLWEFEPGEEIIRQGDWGGNTFYVTVEGALDVYVAGTAGGARKVCSFRGVTPARASTRSSADGCSRASTTTRQSIAV